MKIIGIYSLHSLRQPIQPTRTQPGDTADRRSRPYLTESGTKDRSDRSWGGHGQDLGNGNPVSVSKQGHMHRSVGSDRRRHRDVAIDCSPFCEIYRYI